MKPKRSTVGILIEKRQPLLKNSKNSSKIHSQTFVTKEGAKELGLDAAALAKDYIELISTEHSRIYWCFPKILVCPARFCIVSFPSRKSIIEHYREQHAAFMIFCELCEMPMTRLPSQLRTHYSLLHRGEQCIWLSHVNIIFCWNVLITSDAFLLVESTDSYFYFVHLQLSSFKGVISVDCFGCDQILSSASFLPAHMAEKHGFDIFKCTKDSCTLQTNHRSQLDRHKCPMIGQKTFVVIEFFQCGSRLANTTLIDQLIVCFFSI